MKEGLCKFCGITAKLVKSHIVPRSFYKRDDSGLPHMLIQLDKVGRSKRSQCGLYDSNLNCIECEKYFSTLDTYAADVLFGKRNQRFVCRDEQGILMQSAGLPILLYSRIADPIKLTKFACSVLWRACASEMKEVSAVKLGEVADKIKFGLLNNDVSGFEVAIMKDVNPDWSGFVSIIGETKNFGGSIYRFDAGGFVFLVKETTVKVKRISILFSKYKGHQIYLCQNKSNSVFARKMAGIVKQNYTSYGDPWGKLRK